MAVMHSISLAVVFGCGCSSTAGHHASRVARVYMICKHLTKEMITRTVYDNSLRQRGVGVAYCARVNLPPSWMPEVAAASYRTFFSDSPHFSHLRLSPPQPTTYEALKYGYDIQYPLPTCIRSPHRCSLQLCHLIMPITSLSVNLLPGHLLQGSESPSRVRRQIY